RIHKRSPVKTSERPTLHRMLYRSMAIQDFEGECLTIEGPGGIGDLCSNHMSWCGSIKSLRVGPQAFVLAYADKEYKGKMISLGPGEELADLGNIKFDDEI